MKIKNKLRTKQFVIDEKTNRIQFNDIRFYPHPNGEFFPSVTTILGYASPKDPHLLQFMKENGLESDNIRDAAGVKGSIVHKLTESFDYGLKVDSMGIDEKGELYPLYDIEEWQMFERYVEFRHKVNPVIHHIEVNMVSDTMRTGGTLDRVLTFNGKKYILDIKTSKGFHDDYWLQLEAYRRMWNYANPKDQIEHTCILWLNAKTKGPGVKGAIQGEQWQLKFPDNDNLFYSEIWDYLRKIYDVRFGNIKPKHISYQLSYQDGESNNSDTGQVRQQPEQANIG